MSVKIINNIIETYLPNGTETEINDLKYSLKYLQEEAKKSGILIACNVAENYDKYSSHEHLVSDCVRSKLGLLNRRNIRKNPATKPVKKK